MNEEGFIDESKGGYKDLSSPKSEHGDETERFPSAIASSIVCILKNTLETADT